MTVPALADLLSIPTQDAILNQEVLPEVQKRGSNVTHWIVGGLYRTMAYVAALMRLSARTAIATLCAAGFEDYVFGFTAVPPDPISGASIDVTSWAPVIAKQRYGVAQIAATYTQRTFTLTNSSVGGYGPLLAGSIIVKFPSGNRYILAQTVTIPGAGSVQATFQSEFPYTSSASYNTDPSSSTIQIVTAQYPGVVVTNPSTTYSPVSQVGSGIGSLTLSGAPFTAHSVAVRIDSTGIAGIATWSTSLDNGAWVSQGAAASIANLGGFSINILLADNGGSPSFVAHTVYYFQTPGSDISQLGRPVETPQALGTRCRGLWPALAFAKDPNGNWIPASPTMPAYQALALSASNQVVAVLVQTDGTVNNKLQIVLAGQGAPVPTGVVSLVQAFFNSYSMLTDLVAVSTTTARTITIAALTISCKASLVASAQTALTAALQAFIGGTDASNPLGVNGLVDHGYVSSLARRIPGVVKISDEAMTINGSAADYQMPGTPGAFEQAVLPNGFSAATAFTWNPV